MTRQGSAIFLNQGAGTAQSAKVAETVERAQLALDADLHVANTRDPVEMEAWLGGLIGGYDTAIIVGGDGSLGMALKVATNQEGLTLGYVPAGFGNAARHLLRLPTDPAALVDVLARRDARPVDLVAVRDRLCFFAGAGWDALVAGRYGAAGAHGTIGWASVITTSLPELRHLPEVEVRADGRIVHRGPLAMLIASTTPFYGRGLRVNPGARPDAGRLSLRVYPGPAGQLALEAARWAWGINPKARRIDAAVVEVSALDGSAIPLQTDGDLFDEAPEWRVELRQAVVPLIGGWS